MESPDSYTLTQISMWAESTQVTLPTVQRGFVWKPSQIENLWDSLLRGYPVGSFVLSYGGGRAGVDAPLDLLDGQQRATAICLGFGNKAFKQATNQAKVFIDLESPKGDDNRKYMFRAITKPHPWGYQAVDNTKPLDADNIRKAMKLYGVRDHLDAPLEKFFPYDSVFPLPFDLFLKCALDKAGEKALVTSIEEWEHWETANTSWKSKAAGEPGGKRVLQLTSPDAVRAKIISIYDDVVLMLHGSYGRKARTIPALYLDFNAILAEGVRRPSEQVAASETQVSNDAAEDPKDDEIETLFVRLNAGGTPLRGEELNYSILKANIDSDLQKRIEEACSGLFSPARFITIAYRLFQFSGGIGVREAISMKIKPKQFQKTMTDKKDSKGFTAYLTNLVDAKEFEGTSLLEYARKILVYDEELNPRGLPYLVSGRLSSSAPEVMFMLLYRLKKNEDRFSPTEKPALHRRMLGMVTLFAWLGRGEKLRDHAKLLSNVWPAATQDAEEFWSSATVQRAMLDGVLPQLPTFAELKEVNGAVRQPNSNIWSRFEKNGASSFVFQRIFNNRDLILYAQRQALWEWFEDRLYHLDDTNVPFDWDHIFPNKYVKGKKNIPRILRESYNTNGNFRAWPYPLNRGDQEVLPSVKLNPSQANTTDYPDMVKSWQQYFQGRPRIQADINHLMAQLLKWSKCDEKWTTKKITDVKKHYRQVYDLIIDRNVELCREWYEELLIDSLIQEVTFSFDTFLNNTKWSEMPKKFSDRFEDVDENDFQVSSPLEVMGSRFYFYLCCPSSKEEDLAENLKEGAIFFGVIDETTDGTLSKVRIPTGSEKLYQMSEVGVIDNSFTLISCQEQHYLQLFAQLHGWLINFPAKELGGLAGHLLNCLKTRHRETVLSYSNRALAIALGAAG